MKFKLYLLFLIIISCIPLLSLFHPGLPITNDGKDHVARIANFYANLQQGVLLPRWAGNLNWGYGHPILEFLYPLPSYLASFFHFFGFSLIDATKIVFGMGMLISGICMYMWLAEFLPLPAAFIGGLFYVFTPYRFVEIYVRGDIGENVAFVFMPLTLLFIYKIYKNHSISFPLPGERIKEREKSYLQTQNVVQRMKHQNTNYVILGAISLACLILSHNAISLMYLPFILFYGGYLVYQSKYKKFLFLNSCFLILLAFGLSAFFWIPGLLEGKYTLRNIVTQGDYTKSFVTLSSLFYGTWKYDVTGRFTKQIGIINWIVFIVSLLYLPAGRQGCFIAHKQKNKIYFFVTGLVIYTIIAIFLMLPQSNFIWERLIILQNFQFPWRFLAIPVFTTSVLGAYVVSMFFSSPRGADEGARLLDKGGKGRERWKRWVETCGRGNKKRYFALFFLVLAILFLNKDYWYAKGYLLLPDSFFTGVYNGTTDTGESSPVWSVRFMEQRFAKPMEVIAGKATVVPVQRIITKHVYKVSATTTAGLRENTVYFPGWEVYVDNTIVPIQYQDPHNRGVITFNVEKGNHTVIVRYTETRLRTLADIISLLSLLSIVLYFIVNDFLMFTLRN